MRQPHGLPVRMVCDSERGAIRVGSALTTVRPRPNNASDTFSSNNDETTTTGGGEAPNRPARTPRFDLAQ